jgi:hypothetical protein
MTQLQVAPVTCSQCNGWYDSESELWDHMQTAHRRFISERSTIRQDCTQSENLKNSLSTSKEEWAELSVQLRNRVQVRFDPEEVDVIDRFILLASQGPAFDHVCRSPRLAKFIDRPPA